MEYHYRLVYECLWEDSYNMRTLIADSDFFYRYRLTPFFGQNDENLQIEQCGDWGVHTV